MKHRGVPIIMIGPLLVLTLVLLSAFVPVATSALTKAPLIQEVAIGWQLSDAKVVSTGKTSSNDMGTLSAGYSVEATATAIDQSSLVKKGKFKLTLTAFSPSNDMIGQKAGLWYVRGDWSITDVNATEKEKKARHSSAIIKGYLSAELSFNPATTNGTFDALVRLPMSLAAGQWAKGEGTFSGNEIFEGTIKMNANLWPDVAKIKGVEK